MEITTAKRLDGIGEYYFAQKLREIDGLNKQGKNIINLGIGSPDQPPHPDVIKILQEESAKPNTHAYQNYKGSPVLRNAISEWYSTWYGVAIDPETEVLPLIGSKEGIMHICMTYFEEGVGVLVPNPGYPTYTSAARLSGATPIYYDLKAENGWLPDFAELDKLVATAATSLAQGIKGIFVNYPHMPTGQLPSIEFYKALIGWAKEKNILIIHDNPYSFILNDNPMSLLSVEGAKDVVLELNSLSKSQNMAGWRVGMLVGAKERINEVMRFKSNMDSGMFLPLQLAAATALRLDKSWYDSVNAIYRKRREKVFELLDLLGCQYSKNQVGMFVWAAAPGSLNPSEGEASIPRSGGEGGNHTMGLGGYWSDKVLYDANVFITPGGIFGSEGKSYIRVSLCATEEKIADAIERIKTSLKN